MARVERLALAPIPIFMVLLIVLILFSLQVVFEPPLLLFILNLFFLSIVFFAVAGLAATGYLRTGWRNLLLLGCGALVYGLGSLVTGWVRNIPASGPNMAVTIYNTAALASGLFHLLGAGLAWRRASPRAQPDAHALYLLLAYGGSLLLIVLITMASLQDIIPAFFIQGEGPTALRQLVLGAAGALFTFSAFFFISAYIRVKSKLLYWYGLGLLLLAVGFFIVLFVTNVGSPISWVGRVVQYLGSVYCLVAVLTIIRARDISVDRAVAGFFQEAETNYKTLVEMTTEAIVAFDNQGRVLLWNSAAEKVFHYTHSEAVGAPLVDLIVPAEEADNWRANLEKFRETSDHRFTGRLLIHKLKRKSGQDFPAELSISVRKNAAGWTGISIIRDITERQQSEEAQRLLAEAVEQAARRATRLQALTAALSEALTPAQVAQVVIEQGFTALKASAGSVALLTRDHSEFEIINSVGYLPAQLEQWRLFPVAADLPIRDAVQRGEPIFIDSPETAQASYPRLAATSMSGHQAWAVIPLMQSGSAIGVIMLSFGEAQHFDQKDREFVLALARLCTQAIQRARLYEGEHLARAEALMAWQRLALLSEASNILTTSLNYETTLDRIAHLALPFIADYCLVYDFAEDGTIRQVIAAHANPEKEMLLRQVGHYYQARPDNPQNIINQVQLTGQTVLIPDITETSMEIFPPDDQLTEIICQLKPRSTLVIPLKARGRTLGAINFTWADSGRRYGESDLALAEELANRAAVALDNSRLYSAAQAEITARSQTEQQLAAALQEKDVLLKEVYHRVKNNLQAVSNLIYLQSAYTQDEQTRHLFQDTQDRIKSIALIHEKLYQTSDLAQLNFADYLSSLGHHLVASYRVNPNTIQLQIQAEELFVDLDLAVPLGIIINELVTNSLKHAFPDGLAGEINIELRAAAGQQLLLVVSDNGRGIPENVDIANSKSLGLQLVYMLTSHFKGTVELIREQGTTFRITLPQPDGS